ncbi:hypothetical protein H0N95_00830 [Candidatus Micrarchaeota archaeon]|nr:hypothetical protein [Candidatus Micrarchaeota archaeon]
MKFKIHNKILEQFPGLNIGVLVARGIDNQGTDEQIMKLIQEKEKEIMSNFDSETLSQNPKIDSWRKAYSSFGAKPKKYRCCAENLYRMILDGIDLKHINKLVDVYTYILIKHMIPTGGDDIDKIDGDIMLKFAEGNESFKELNKEEITNPKPGEVVYMDNEEVLCRRWNWRECDKSKMTENTRNAALVVEGLPPVTKEEIEEILRELKELIQGACGGKVNCFILDINNPEINI